MEASDESRGNSSTGCQTRLRHKEYYDRQHLGRADPRKVPCSALGVRSIAERATMGPGSGAVAARPSANLRARGSSSRESNLKCSLAAPQKRVPRVRTKDPLPRRQDRPVMGLSSGRDFVAENVAEAAAAAAAGGTPRGSAEPVQYIFKPGFGEVPPYLVQRQAERAAQAAAAAAAADAPKLPPGVERVLGGEEVAALVAALRERWGGVHAAYQRLPCVVDTPSKRRRKEELETQLAEVEGDLASLEGAQVVHLMQPRA